MLIFYSMLDIPLTDPIAKFLLILAIMLVSPLVLNKFKAPPLLSLIIAGIIVGPHSLNLIERDSSIIMSGTAGLLYIMFLAGLEIDLADFRKNSSKSIVFGMYTFLIPMTLGTLAGIYLLHYSIYTSILLASMFASHTLITYPLISKLGISKNSAVNIAIGGTMITDTLALLVLAVIVGLTKGDVTSTFWLKLSFSLVIFSIIIIFVFPLISRWFFKKFEDKVSQYIFVLVMVYLGAFLATLAGVEAIIGAFLVGLVLNRLIPQTSPLMNRIDFVGNAIFIPFFLIGVGMLIDYKVFFNDFETIKVSIIMIVIATTSKYGAAWLTQKTYKFSADERRLIFGLSNAQAAATLAAVTVGYNIILGETITGEPIRLLNESILNGTILMILVTCSIASFVSQKGAKNIALLEASKSINNESTDNTTKILIPINEIELVDDLINLGLAIKSKKAKTNLYALTMINNNSKDDSADKKAKKILKKATSIASATDNSLTEILRYDLNLVNGLTSEIKKHNITDLILGIKSGISFSGNKTEEILNKCDTSIFVYKPMQPLGTIQRHVVIIPETAHEEAGFIFWLSKIWNLAENSATKFIFYASKDTIKAIKDNQVNYSVDSEYVNFSDWEDFLILSRDFQKDDNLIIVLSRKNKTSSKNNMKKIPSYLNKYFYSYSYILIFPRQYNLS
jgi:Kef-type K+ transport system membrane component KefB